MPAGDAAALAAAILSDHAGETVVVAGHSNTVDDIIEALGGPALGDIPEDQFDNMFIVTVCCNDDVGTLL